MRSSGGERADINRLIHRFCERKTAAKPEGEIEAVHHALAESSAL
jgi:hypothetical protein